MLYALVFGLGIIIGLPIWVITAALVEELTVKRSVEREDYWNEDVE